MAERSTILLYTFYFATLGGKRTTVSMKKGICRRGNSRESKGGRNDDPVSSPMARNSIKLGPRFRDGGPANSSAEREIQVNDPGVAKRADIQEVQSLPSSQRRHFKRLSGKILKAFTYLRLYGNDRPQFRKV